MGRTTVRGEPNTRGAVKLLFPGAWDSSRPLSGDGLRNRAKDAWKEASL